LNATDYIKEEHLTGITQLLGESSYSISRHDKWQRYDTIR